MITIKINPEKIRDVIGKGRFGDPRADGRNRHDHRHLRRRRRDDREHERDGMAEAKKRIEQITAEIEVGQVYEGTVLKLLDFRRDREPAAEQDGLLHISEVIQTDEKGRDAFVGEGALLNEAAAASQSDTPPQRSKRRINGRQCESVPAVFLYIVVRRSGAQGARAACGRAIRFRS